MIAHCKKTLALAAMTVVLATPLHAAEVCGWLVETIDEEQMHKFDLWLEADQDTRLYYQMAGEGVTTDGSRAHSPGGGTYSLRAGEPAQVWGFGTGLEPPGDIDIVAELHAPPKDIFSDEVTPLIATFAFRRHVPEGEAEPPKTFATRQCAPLTPAAR